MTLALLTLFLSSSFAYEDFSMEDVFHKRPQRFSFGLGKRSSVTVEPLDHLKLMKLRQLISRGVWGRTGPHGLFKRSAETPVEDVKNDADTLVGRLGWWGLADPHGLFKKSMTIADESEEPIKRGAYSFGLGKRSAAGQYSFGLGKRAQQFSFGLGKRGQQFSFGLGK